MYCRHAAEICNMALELKAACGMVVRPDIAPRTITIRAGIHTGCKYLYFSSQILGHNDDERYKFSKFNEMAQTYTQTVLHQFGTVYIDYFFFIVFIFQDRLWQELLDLKCPDTVFLGILLTQLQGWKPLEKVAFL